MSLYLSLTAPNPKWVAYCSEEVLDSVGPSIGLTVGLTTEGNTPAEAVALLQTNVRQYREDLHKRATLFDDYSGRLARYTDPDVLWLTSHGFQECADCAVQFQRNNILVSRFWSKRDGGAFRWMAETRFAKTALPYTADSNSAAGALEDLSQLMQHIADDAARRAQDIALIVATIPDPLP